ncbi:hypothetical protein OAP32_00560 [Crocinitomicaceae bacterium]|nr:hypothetical protein [Crocinitomicaceae bacterium]
MYISVPLFTDMVKLPKNQARLLSEIVLNIDPTTNVGFISYERLTASQAQRVREDARQLVKLDYIRKFPITRASVSMKTLRIAHSNCITFYMLNPIHAHSLAASTEGLKEIWQLLK